MDNKSGSKISFFTTLRHFERFRILGYETSLMFHLEWNQFLLITSNCLFYYKPSVVCLVNQKIIELNFYGTRDLSRPHYQLYLSCPTTWGVHPWSGTPMWWLRTICPMSEILLKSLELSLANIHYHSLGFRLWTEIF